MNFRDEYIYCEDEDDEDDDDDNDEDDNDDDDYDDDCFLLLHYLPIHILVSFHIQPTH